MFSGGLSAWHLLIVVVAFIVLFGAKKLPDAARSLGRSARIFKAETQGLLSDDKPEQQAVQSSDAAQLQDQAAQLRAQAARLEQAAKAAEATEPKADQAPKTS